MLIRRMKAGYRHGGASEEDLSGLRQIDVIRKESAAKLLELAVSQGIWAVLYIYLFFRMLKENKEREERYQNTISLLSGNIESGIRDIKSQLEDMADSISDGMQKRE